MLVTKFKENDKVYFIDSDYLVETIRFCDKVESEYNATDFQDCNYKDNPDKGYQIAILTELGVCYFKNTKDAVKSYTINKPMQLLTDYEKLLIIKYFPNFSDVISL